MTYNNININSINNKLSYRRGSVRRSKSVEILSTAAQLYEKNNILTGL